MSRRWPERWLLLLDDAAAGSARRASRGASLYPAGRVTDVRIAPGRLNGSVQGTRATPYTVSVSVPVLGPDAWARVVDALAGQVQHSARLLAGQTPEGLETEVEAAGVRLFPARDELVPECQCADTVPVCAHVWGLWHAAAVILESDPFALLLLRGRGRQQLLTDLADARSRGSAAVERGTELSELDPDGWWSVRAALEPPPRAAGPAGDAPLLRALGDPPGWAGGVGAWDLFRPLVARGAGHARVLLEDEG